MLVNQVFVVCEKINNNILLFFRQSIQIVCCLHKAERISPLSKIKNSKIIFLLFTTIVLAIVLIVKPNTAVQFNSTQFLMNSFVQVSFNGKNAEKAGREVFTELKAFENEISMHINGSLISQINTNAGIQPVKLNDRALYIVSQSKKYSQLSNGLFDITIAPVVTEWGITSENPKVPSKEKLNELLALVDYHDIIIDEANKTAMLARKGQSIDLGAVAKGYACDIVREIAQKHKITSGFVSVGGNTVIIGKKPDGSDYNIGLRDPNGDETQYILSLNFPDRTMATSGAYERFFIDENGNRYHHIIDPRTGYPAESDLLSVSVISKSGILTDILSTTFFIEGLEEVKKNLNNPDYDIIAVDKQNNVYMSENIKAYVKQNNSITSYNLLF